MLFLINVHTVTHNDKAKTCILLLQKNKLEISHFRKFSDPVLSTLLKHLSQRLQPWFFLGVALQAWHTCIWGSALEILSSSVRLLIFHHNFQINSIKIIQCYFLYSFFFVSMMKITGLSHLFKWENLYNWWLTKYFFAPLYILCSIPSTASCLCRSAIVHPYIYMYIFLFIPLHLCVLGSCCETFLYTHINIY